MVTIAVIGEFDPTFAPHMSIIPSMVHARPQSAQIRQEVEWLDTIACQSLSDFELSRFDGFWIAPGSPYKSLAGALRVISYARTKDVPLLGTCGGFQHVALEYARNVMGFADAQHAEYDPYSSHLFISKLDCSLAGQSMSVELLPNSIAYGTYMTKVVTERYYCDFGLNLAYLEDLKAAGLVVSGVDTKGEPRIIELQGLRFFVATLFVPQTKSTQECPHPVVSAFLDAAYGVNQRHPDQENSA